MSRNDSMMGLPLDEGSARQKFSGLRSPARPQLENGNVAHAKATQGAQVDHVHKQVSG